MSAALVKAIRYWEDERGHFGNCHHRVSDNRPDGSWWSHIPNVECPADRECGGKGSTTPGFGMPCSRQCVETRAAMAEYERTQRAAEQQQEMELAV